MKDKNCPICTKKVMGLSPEGWDRVVQKHNNEHYEGMKKHRMIKSVPDTTWTRFSRKAQIKGITQAELLELLLSTRKD